MLGEPLAIRGTGSSLEKFPEFQIVRQFSITLVGNAFACHPKVKELLVLRSPRAILGPFNILVDIGVPAEKEVIQ